MKRLFILFASLLIVSCASSQNTGDVLTWQGTRGKYVKPARTLPAFPNDSTKIAAGDSTWLKLLTGFGINFSWAGDSLSISVDTSKVATISDLDSVTARDTVNYAAYSGTANSATSSQTSNYANSAGGAPPTGLASGVLKNYYPGPDFADNVIKAQHIQSGQLIKSINGLFDNILIVGRGGVSISLADGPSVDTMKIAGADTTGGDSSGVAAIQNTDGTLDITDPTGPTTTVNIKNNTVDSTKLGTASVGTDEVADGSITTLKFNVTAIAPYSNYATTAGGAPPTGSAVGTYISGTYPNGLYLNTNAVDSFKITDGHVTNGKLANSSVTTAKILNGTILREDVGSTFKSPYADTADYAKAGLLDDNSVTTAKILNSTILNEDLTNNSVQSSNIVNNTVKQEDLDSTILRKTNIIPGFILQGSYTSPDTLISSTSTPASMLDSTQNLYFITNYAHQNASTISRGNLAIDRLTNSGVAAGTYNWGTVNEKGIVTQANNVSGGGGGGAGLTGAFRGRFSGTATEDSNYIAGAHSYDTYQIQPVMGSRNDPWNANDDYRYYPDSNYVIIQRNADGTADAWFDLYRYDQTLAMPTGVNATALSATSVQLTWTDPAHNQSFTTATTESVVVTFRTGQYDSVYAMATNKYYCRLGCQDTTITGLTAGQLYYFCVVPLTRANESDTALTGNRDTCTTQEGESEAFFNAKDSLGSLQAWNSVRFLGSKSNLDVIEAAELIDSSGNSRVFAYGTQTNTQKARYLADQVNGYGAIALAYRDSGETRDTCVITCDALAQYISANAENKPFTLVLVAKIVQGNVGGYGGWQAVWSSDVDGSTSNWGGGRVYTTAPTTIGYRRMVAGTDHSYDPSNGSESLFDWHVWEWVFDGNNITLYCDSNIVGIETAMDYDTHQADMFTLGAMRYLLAGVMDYSALRYTEFLFMSKEASAYERSYYNKWLKSIYAIQ